MSTSDGAARLRQLTASAERGDGAAQAELAEALFCSALQPSSMPSADEVRDAVREVVHRHGDDPTGCACDVAERYGADPEGARERMRWCRNVVAVTYSYPDGSGTDESYLRGLFWRRA